MPESTPAPPRAGRAAWVVVPARDELHHLPLALAALDAAARAAPGPVHLVLVDDGSTDGTAAVVATAVAHWPHGSAAALAGPGVGSGWARRTGLDHASAAAAHESDPTALVATTDADSLVPPNWLAGMHALVDRGHEVIAGDVHLEAGTDPLLVEARDVRLAARLLAVRRGDPDAPHPHFAGANLGCTLRALTTLAPLPAPRALEDDALLQRCRALGVTVTRAAGFPVRTSARTTGRADVGLATALAADLQQLALAADPSRAVLPSA